MIKPKLNKCSVCLKEFKLKIFFEGILGLIPIALHKTCYNKLMKKDELILEDYESKRI